MIGLLLVTVGAAVGSGARFALDIGSRRWFPSGPSVGILVVNLVGSFVLGVLVGLMATRLLDDRWRLLVGIGFCGSFTTFSTFVVELAELIDVDRRRVLLAWTAAAVVGGGMAAALGVGVGRAW